MITGSQPDTRRLAHLPRTDDDGDLLTLPQMAGQQFFVAALHAGRVFFESRSGKAKSHIYRKLVWTNLR